MEETSVFASLAIMIAATVLVALVFHRLRQSMIIAYFVSGVVIGPGCLNFVHDEELISLMAEVGVIVLMFTLGIEFSLAKLKRLKHAALRGGTFYVFSLMGGALAVVYSMQQIFAHGSLGMGLILGLVLAMSSTAIAIRMLDESGQINTAQAQLAIGTSIFQDIIVVPAMIIIPAVISGGDNVTGTLWMAFVKAVLFLLFAYLLAKFVIPFILEYVADTRSRELFTIMVLGLCLGIAFVGNLLGLSLALGAFVAGLVVSESIYSHKILADILPFKDFFLSIFFVSAGMLLNTEFLFTHLGWVLLIAGLAILSKYIIGFIGGLLSGYTPRVSSIASMSLATVGEFSFVLLQWGKSKGYIGDDLFQLLLSVTLVTMGVVPILWKWAMPLAKWMEKLPFINSVHGSPMSFHETVEELNNHAIICGCGPVGQKLVDYFKATHKPFLVLEMNAGTVKALRQDGVFALYADAAQTETHSLARTKEARSLIITIPDMDIASAIVTTARKINRNLYIVARVKFSAQAEALQKLGVDSVILDEREAGLEVLRRIMVREGDDPLDAIKEIRELRIAEGDGII
ncbi:MAG: cation:proton antiporter [Verrucomicrobiota bacterium]|nr:cation:proton antiporter [Verrucomicrobiota bacterium]